MSDYRVLYRPEHKRASASGDVYEHVIVAETAIGHVLPDGAEVHHVDENISNNANTNLVICQDRAYHKLLHYRAKVIRAGHNPNIEKFCGDCARWRLLGDFYLMRANKSTGRQSVCSECQIKRDEKRRRGQSGRRTVAA